MEHKSIDKKTLSDCNQASVSMYVGEDSLSICHYALLYIIIWDVLQHSSNTENVRFVLCVFRMYMVDSPCFVPSGVHVVEH